ncbi:MULTISPECIES: hypothetical protein [unclassified Streptomyces]|uniref:hypothetical protein n=1 Tax=unclassified Streptomyces TaxID=2593676 RepID=UPI00193B3FA5|nr:MULTISPECIES: hypothetical protein [unclassified Streptomyces]MCI4146124.1 hypothetical protein [Streptomyces sp. MMS20-AI2-20]
MPHTSRVIVLQPVLEVAASPGFALWPVAGIEPYGFLPLSGALTPAEVGTAVMSIAAHNDVVPAADDSSPRPEDPLGSFLHGLLTMDDLFVSGGLRVTDTASGVTLLPGCCNGLEERGDWLDVLDGSGWATFGHDPSPLAERHGDAVRLTVDADRDDSPVIECTAGDLRRLLTGAERDLTEFLDLATAWTARQLPGHITPVISALARALLLPLR